MEKEASSQTPNSTTTPSPQPTLEAKPRKNIKKSSYLPPSEKKSKYHSFLFSKSSDKSITYDYGNLYVTRINPQSSHENLKKIVMDAQRRRSSRFNWHALYNIGSPFCSTQ